MPLMPYKIALSGSGRAPYIAHVPHACTLVPTGIRAQMTLTDEELQRELVRMTDWHADHLFSWVLRHGGAMFASEVSRLVFDPERFRADADEPMAAKGQGAIYTHTTDGVRFATLTAEERERRLEEYYDTYHEGLRALVTDRLERFGLAVILDCHSFASVPLPSEPDQSPERPDICIGTDAFHTPPGLAEVLVAGFRAEGFTVAIDRPFAGTMVPLDRWGSDPRVHSVMIEIRRGLYCDEATGVRNERFDEVRAAIERAVMGATAG